MYITVNQVELCCSLASRKMKNEMQEGGFTDEEIYRDLKTHTEYTELAQDVFDKHYDYYWDMVDRCNVTRSTISVG
tara:strand:- start:7801 stop:8028 length:228 start_codon:yes stop_codon:yes gene_type:complete